MALSSSAKRKIWGRDKYVCHYCGITCKISLRGNDRVTIDHIRARSTFKHSEVHNRASNLVTACNGCNQRKGQLPYDVFIKRLDRNPVHGESKFQSAA